MVAEGGGEGGEGVEWKEGRERDGCSVSFLNAGLVSSILVSFYGWLWASAVEMGDMVLCSTLLMLRDSDPLRLSTHLLSQCLSRGVHLHTSTHALSITRNSSGHISSIRIRDANGVES